MGVQAGILNFDGSPVNREILARISQSVAAYGPDGETSMFDGPVGMLCRAFHTTPESRLEHQPFVSASGKTLTWDGRLDNRDELIAQLSHILVADRTDVAIVAAAFDQYGTNCFAKLIGDWAVSIWDPTEKQLILARDYIGVKHLFYYPSTERVLWCNHLSPLALCGDQFSLSEEYIAGYLRFWPEPHLTPYAEIRSVAPGHFVRMRNGCASEHPYWSFDPTSKIRYKTDEEYEEQFRYLFRQAVRRRLRTDSPILAELSGGLDSSSIVCMSDDLLAREGLHNLSVDTVSCFDRNEPDDNDYLYFTKVEEKRGRVGHHVEMKCVGDSFRFDYPEFIPTPGFEGRAEFRTAKARIIERGRYRVVLSGEGGDFILGQVRNPRTQMADLLARARLRELRKLLLGWSRCSRQPLMKLLFQSVVILIPTLLRTRLRLETKWLPWVDTNFARRYGVTYPVLTAAEGRWFWSPIDRESFQTVHNLARVMTIVDPSVAENRYPFLDQTLTEFLTSIPVDQLLRPGERRSLLRRALASILPQEISARALKASASRYFALSLQKHWNLMARSLASPISAHLGYIHRERFEASLLAMRSGHAHPYCVQLLKTLFLEFWLRDVVARNVISIRFESDTAQDSGSIRKHSTGIRALGKRVEMRRSPGATVSASRIIDNGKEVITNDV